MKKKQTKVLAFKMLKLSFMLLVFLSTTVAFAQETSKKKTKGTHAIEGVVEDENGEPIPGVNIQEQGSYNGTISDIDGKFEMKVHPDSKLILSFLGLETQIVSVDGKETLKVVLKEKANELDEVTVVAFSKQKKESVISSISTVKVGELKVPSSNLTTALAGKMSGVISYQRSGEPGADNADFFIRGVSTFGSGKVDPLILIDGVEMTKDDLARMQPDDIATFSIMKDASATALYGARGANGVVMITTKEGREGKTNVSIRFENSFSKAVDEVELADPITYMNLWNEGYLARNPLKSAPYSLSKIEGTKKGLNPYAYPAVNWYDEMMEDYTNNQRLNFSISGGGKKARYYIAGTYSVDNGNLKEHAQNTFASNIDLKRYLLRSNININLTETTEAVVRFYGSFDDYTGPIDGGSTVYTKVMRANPVLFPKFYPQPSWYTGNRIFFGNADTGNHLNPFADMVKGYKDYTKSLMSAQIEIKQNLDMLTQGLRFRLLGNSSREAGFDVQRFYNPYFYKERYFDAENNKLHITTDPINQNPTDYLDYKEGNKLVKSVVYLESAVDYNRTFNEIHNVTGMLVGTLRETRVANAGDLLKSLPYRNMGLSGRFTYDYDGRYLFETNFGYNGSERFSEKERFGFFPSVGIGWIASNESFWKPIKDIVNTFKIRLTHGKVGNDAIGDANDRFFYLSKVNMNDGKKSYTFGKDYQNNGYTTRLGGGGVSISRYANERITWEISEESNLGLEFDFLNAINLQVDLFKKERENILMDRANIPTTMGLQATQRANVGVAETEGIDISLSVQKSFSNDFWVSARANFTYAESKFKYYEEPDYSIGGMPWVLRTGSVIGKEFGYVAERLFIDDNDVKNSATQFGEYGPGDIKYKDLNKDGVINDLDKKAIGNPRVPKINYGFGASLGYKGIDFSFFFQGSAKSSFFLDPNAITPFIDPDTKNSQIESNQLLKVIADDHWSETNNDPYAFWPKLSTTPVENNTKTSTWYLHDGGFLRLKSVELGYNLSKEVLSLFGLTQIRFYISGTNLLTFSDFELWDPEMAGNGLGYPIQQVYNMGVQVKF
jgi:TonB-linked SusC/RagA family outer membrane protein